MSFSVKILCSKSLDRTRFVYESVPADLGFLFAQLSGHGSLLLFGLWEVLTG